MQFQEKKKWKVETFFPPVFPKITSTNFPTIPFGHFCINTAVYQCTHTNGLPKNYSEKCLLYSFCILLFSLVKHLLISFFLPIPPSETRPPYSSQACLVSNSSTFTVGGGGSSCFPGASPWCPPQAGHRGPCGPPRREPLEVAAARPVHHVLPGWLGHWHTHSEPGTPGPASWGGPLPLVLWGYKRREQGSGILRPFLLSGKCVSPLPHQMFFLSIPSLLTLFSRSQWTVVPAKEMVQGLCSASLQLFSEYYYTADCRTGTEKDLLLWRGSPFAFFNLS
jgi:hypothetical protein